VQLTICGRESGKSLLEMFVSKGMAGTGFEVFLELISLSIVLKPDGYCKAMVDSLR